MRRVHRYQSPSFGVSWSKNTGSQDLWFRVSRKCFGSVKRNKVKRVLRHRLGRVKQSCSTKMIVHVHQKHVSEDTCWQDYLKRLKHDLEEFAAYMEGRTSKQSRRYAS